MQEKTLPQTSNDRDFLWVMDRPLFYLHPHKTGKIGKSGIIYRSKIKISRPWWILEQRLR